MASKILEFIKVEHSLFSLPFIYSGTLLAMKLNGIPLGNFWDYFVWVTLAAIGARTAAMTINRIIDRGIDAKNPRTKERALATRKLTLGKAYLITVVSSLLLFFSSYKLNHLALSLSPVPLAFFVLYPYMKRISWLSHLVLGISWAIGPLGGWVAVTGSFESFSVPLALALSGALWVTGFDIIYALLDSEFDRKEKLFSIPAAFGPGTALNVSFAVHLAMFLPLVYIRNAVNLGAGYAICLAAAFSLIMYEHAISRKRDEKSINTAFFSVNAVVGWIIFAGVLWGSVR